VKHKADAIKQTAPNAPHSILIWGEIWYTSGTCNYRQTTITLELSIVESFVSICVVFNKIK